MKGWALGVTVLTFILLATGLFCLGIQCVLWLAETNRLVWMLAALACWAGAAVYGRILGKLLD